MGCAARVGHEDGYGYEGVHVDTDDHDHDHEDANASVDVEAPEQEAEGPRGPGGSSQVTGDELADCTPPLLFGHRGTRAAAPENTLAAFGWAAEEGADGLEIDVRKTADEVLVVLHDATVGRTTDALADLPVAELTLEELRQFDAGAWFDAAFVGETVPTLDEVLSAYARTTLRFLLDVKDAELLPALVAAVDEWGVRERAIFASSRLSVLWTLHELAPDLPTLYFADAMAELPELALPSLRYVRVPKPVEAQPDNARRVVEAGYDVAISARYQAWQSATTTLTALVLSDNLAAAVRDRRTRRPESCPGP